MKKIITIALAFTFLFSSFAVTTFASSSSGGYVKVKKATYQKYKKAYTQNKTLKKEYAELQTEYSDLLEKYELTQMELEEKDGLNSWTWMNIKSLGLTYKDKVWTIPEDFPSSFMINGTTYTIQR